MRTQIYLYQVYFLSQKSNYNGHSILTKIASSHICSSNRCPKSVVWFNLASHRIQYSMARGSTNASIAFGPKSEIATKPPYCVAKLLSTPVASQNVFNTFGLSVTYSSPRLLSWRQKEGRKEGRKKNECMHISPVDLSLERVATAGNRGESYKWIQKTYRLHARTNVEAASDLRIQWFSPGFEERRLATIQVKSAGSNWW